MKPYLLILSCGLLWGVTFSLTLIATSEGAHPLGLSAWQIFITACLYALICIISKVPLFDIKHLRHYLVLVVVGITIPTTLYFYAAPHLSAGILSITISTVPLFTYGLMLFLRLERIVIKRTMGIVLGMIAILLLVLPDQGLASDDASLWVMLVLVCAIMYTIENIYISEGISHSIDLRELLCGSNIIASMIQFPIAIWMGVNEPVEWLATGPGLAIAGIAIISGIAYGLFFYTIKFAGPVFASQCAYIITISGVIWGIILFSESHSVWVWMSVAVMMMGLALVTPKIRIVSETSDH
ncbi:MAG: drug/metabolite transporter (DMT)-like permease [Gammaproteobacteria bacterium]